MRKLLIYLKEFKKESILAPLFKMLEAFFELLVPLVMAAIIDRGIEKKDIKFICFMCILLVSLGIVGLISSLTAQFFAAKAAVGMSTKIREKLFCHIQGFSFSQIDDIGISAMVARMTSDINQVQSSVNMVLRLFLRSPFIVFGAMIMAFTVDKESAMVFTVTIPALLLVVTVILILCIPYYRKVQEKLEKVLTITRENLTGVRVIRAFHMEDMQKKNFREGTAELTRMQLVTGRVSALLNPVTYTILNLSLIALIWSGTLRIEDGYITKGALVALINYMLQILVEIVKLVNMIMLFPKAIASGNRIQEIFDMESGTGNTEDFECNLTDDLQKYDVAVEFSHVSFSYQDAGAEAVSDISFQVKRGQTLGIIGGTGSGKTTVASLIPGFYQADSGQVRINGKDVKDYSASVLREKMGIVMQKPELFRGTIRENIRFGKESASEQEIWDALRMAAADEFVKENPLKLDAPVSQRGSNLSGGQRQRLSIARAFVRKPEILILDDSFSALDYETDAKLRERLRECKDTTLLIISQREASIRHADQILVLEDGIMAGLGSHEELLKECEVYKEIYYSQFLKEVTHEQQ